MHKPAAYLSAILVGAIIWFFFQHFQIEGTEALRVVPKSDGPLISAGQAASGETDELSDLSLASDRLPISDLSSDSRTAGKVRKPAVSEPIPGKVPARSPLVASQHRAAATVHKTPTKTPGKSPGKTPGKQHPYAPPHTPNTIRIASFHLNFFGSSADNPEITMNAVARVVRLFDVLALQGVSPGGKACLTDLVAKAGSKYGYLVGETAANANTDQIVAFVYNRDTIVADRGDGFYTLGDPDDLLRRDPLIGWFRAKQAPEDVAFTFSLVNVHVERRHALQELNVLNNVFYEVRQDWRDEDDVIMLGCFQRPESQLANLSKVRGLVPAVRGIATTVRGDEHTENILFRRQETDEYTGRSGVFHFLRAYNLSLNQALQVSDYLPVWAEFSIFEKGSRVARRK